MWIHIHAKLEDLLQESSVIGKINFKKGEHYMKIISYLGENKNAKKLLSQVHAILLDTRFLLITLQDIALFCKISAHTAHSDLVSFNEPDTHLASCYTGYPEYIYSSHTHIR